MKKLIVVGGALVIAIAAPLLAQHAGQGRGGQTGWMNEPQTREDAEAKVKAHFTKLDTNSDGSVTQAEADGARASMRADRQSKHFEMMDTNKDGSISRPEFDAGHKDGMNDGGQGEMGREKRGGRRDDQGGDSRLMRADANKDGKVTLSEMNAATLARFDAADTDKNGTVTPEERRAARQAHRTERRSRR
jgi:Ca2+-binding EF-hand superfamily protein